MRFICLIALLFTILPYPRLAAETLPYKEMILPDYQWENLKKDFPLEHLALSEDARELALVGRRALWLWHLETSRLLRLSLLRDEDQDARLHQVIFINPKKLIVTSDQSLFHVDIGSGKVLHFPHDQYAGGVETGYGLAEDSYFWLHSDGVRQLNLNTLTLTKIFPHSLFQPGDKAWYDPQLKQIWVARDRLILRKDIKEGRVKTHLIHKGSTPFKAVFPFAGQLFTYTPHTVLRFAPPAQFLGAIPVEGARSLVSVGFGPTVHGFLFDDSLLEVYELPAKAKKQYVIKGLEQATSPQSLVVGGPIAAFISAGRPRVLFLN